MIKTILLGINTAFDRDMSNGGQNGINISSDASITVIPREQGT